MGISEWGFLIMSQEQLDEILAIIEKHNKILREKGIEEGKVGEEISLGCIPRHKERGRWRYYFCAGNGGGRDYTSAFIREHYKGLVFY